MSDPLKTGLATAVDIAVAGGTRGPEISAGAGGEADLVDLFDDLPDAPMPVAPVVAKSGPQGGRPKGARNKSTEQWRQYLLGRYRSPLVGLLEIASRSPKDLAKELGLYERVPIGGGEYEDRLATGDAFRAQIEAMRAALPYLHSKAPAELQVTGDGRRGVFVLGDLNVDMTAEIGLALPDAETEENQRVIEAEPAQSDGGQSDGER